MGCLIAGVAATLRGDHERAGPALRRAVVLGGRLTGSALTPTALTCAAAAGLLVAVDGAAHRLAERAVELARERGELSMLSRALELRAVAEYWLGRHEAAAETSRDGLRVARATGQVNCANVHLGMLAVLAAIRADRDTSLRRIREIGESPTPGSRPHALAAWALAVLDLVDGRHAEAAEPAGVAGPARHRPGSGPRAGDGHPVPGGGGGAPGAPAGGDGRARRVRQVGQQHREPVAPGPVRAVPRAARAPGRRRGGTGVPDGAAAAPDRGRHVRAGPHRTALRPGVAPQPTPSRRADAPAPGPRDVQPARGRRAGPSRPPRSCGRPGSRSVRRTCRAARLLTGQQLRIAELVAEGATNREIAARMFLSTRTVDHHLRNVFHRLGIRSRTELARAFTAERHVGLGLRPVIVRSGRV